MNGAAMNQLPQQHNVQPVPGDVGQYELSDIPTQPLSERVAPHAERGEQVSPTEQHLGSVSVRQEVVGMHSAERGNYFQHRTTEYDANNQPIHTYRELIPQELDETTVQHAKIRSDAAKRVKRPTELPLPGAESAPVVAAAQEAAPASPEPAAESPVAAAPRPYAFADSRPGTSTGPQNLDELLAKASASGIEVDTAAPPVRSSGRPAAVQPSPRPTAVPQTPAEAGVPAPGIPEAAKPDDWRPGDLGPGDLARRREALKQASIAQSQAEKARIRAATPRGYIPGN